MLASLLSRGRRPGDVYLLYGDVGAGKSAFARSFIRAAALDDELPVPSPTFLLHNVYDDDVVADGGERQTEREGEREREGGCLIFF